jgi:hypothetical protein
MFSATHLDQALVGAWGVPISNTRERMLFPALPKQSLVGVWGVPISNTPVPISNTPVPISNSRELS